MFRKWIVLCTTLMALALLVVVVQAGPTVPGADLGTAFTYQGQLDLDGQPVDNTCDFQFGLYGDDQGGVQIGATQAISDVTVSAGLFTVQLDFGASAFQGGARWLGVQVQCAGDASFTDLGLQALTATPYALYAMSVPWAGITHMPAGFADGVDDTGSGGEGWALTGNAATDPTAHFLGTTDEVSLTLAVSGTHALHFEPTGGTPNLIGGSEYNTVTLGVVGATIGGGGSSSYPNYVSADYGTIGGGGRNIVGVTYATVGGGVYNTASGLYATVGGGDYNTASDDRATVGGGYYNAASGDYATVSGGGLNTASGYAATVGGGYGNIADGFYATIPGGLYNTASGASSFAAGFGAQALHGGAIVLADGQPFVFPSVVSNTFQVRATGGISFVLGIDGTGAPTWSCQVQDGDSWSCSSDRNLKENLDLVAGGEVLQRLAEVPIYTWNGKGQDPALRHMGPMAQDFYAAFGLGGDDTHIATIDLDGVALAAIQELHTQNQTLEMENADLHRQVDDLEARLSALEDRVAAGAEMAPVQANLLPGVGMFLVGGVGLWLVRRKPYSGIIEGEGEQ